MAKHIKNLEEIFGRNIEMQITGGFCRKIGSSLMRDANQINDSYTIILSTYDEEDDDKDVVVAFMNLNIVVFDSLEEAWDLADAEGEDEASSTEYAIRYIYDAKNDGRNGYIEINDFYVACDLKNLYISPKFRGKGVSKAITLLIPEIVHEVGYGAAVITTYLNPFAKQVELTEDMQFDPNEFGGYSLEDGTLDPEIIKNASKSLKDCGFADYGDNHFVTDTVELRKIGIQNGFDYTRSIKACKYDY